MTPQIIAYKGFNKDLTCTPDGVPFQYEIGKTYDNGGLPVKRCGSGGFHWVEMPLDAFSYYGPATSRYCEVVPSGEIAREADSDTKGASSVLTVTVDISVGDLTRRAVAWVAEMARKQGNGASAAGYRAHASTAGNYAHASTAGDDAHASTAGNYAHASTAGYRAHASTAGDDAHASVKGKNAIAHAAGMGSTAEAYEGSAISLAAYDITGNLVAVRSSLVGQNGVEAGKRYRLLVSGEFEEVAP